MRVILPLVQTFPACQHMEKMNTKGNLLIRKIIGKKMKFDPKCA